ncbi:SDR family NAD(P)-dependent oxidoreductase [Streptomyces sp. NPDC056190]|uniref:SDR family NAD(P)-dependent oxidoreductase n=1 Tax=Streptomyces sp. NPDC056190 TaxID=3345741 RepID=UPI0035E2697C
MSLDVSADARRSALVTGANGALGRELCRGLAAAGFRVIAAARTAEAADEVARDVSDGTRAVALEVTDPASVRAAVERFPDIDVLINNAGVLLTAGATPTAVDLAAVEQEFAVNALGAWRVAQAVLPGMTERGWGRIVNISSGTASFTHGLIAHTPGYTVSKAALNALTVLLAEQTRGTGVLVNAVNPGQLRTRLRPQAPRLPEEAVDDLVRLVTLPDDGPTGGFFKAGGATMGW